MTLPKHPSMLKGKKSKLTAEDVSMLRDADARGVLNVREAARFLGVGAETIRRALRGETWNSVALPPSTEEIDRAAAESLERMKKLLAGEKEKAKEPERLLDEMSGLDVSAYPWLKQER